MTVASIFLLNSKMSGKQQMFREQTPRRQNQLAKLLSYRKASIPEPLAPTGSLNMYNWMVSRAQHHLFAVMFVAGQLLGFLLSFLHYASNSDFTTLRSIYGNSYVVTKAAGTILHLDIAIVMLPVCHLTISLFKQILLGRPLRFGKDSSLHKMVGWSIALFTGVHVVAHWITLARLAGHGHQGFRGFLLANMTTGSGGSGYTMLIALILVSFTSIKKFSNPSFKHFWTMHHLYVVVFISWSLHGAFSVSAATTTSWTSTSIFWQYWLVGGMVYLAETGYRELWATRKLHISRVIQHPSYIVEVQIKKGTIKPKIGQVSSTRDT